MTKLQSDERSRGMALKHSREQLVTTAFASLATSLLQCRLLHRKSFSAADMSVDRYASFLNARARGCE